MKNSEIQVRRKPRQSRAKLTQEALQESFVRLLHERSVDKITIRQITDVAGVGLGTFYEYFSKKEDLIALTIHLHVKHNADQMQNQAKDLISSHPDLAFFDYINSIVHFQIEQIRAQQFLWAQTFLLERQISNIESYRKSYAMMVNMWQNILLPFFNDEIALYQMSLNMQRICYGFISQSLLIHPYFHNWQVLERDINQCLIALA